MSLTHFNSEGRARMVDVTEKGITRRSATAAGRVYMRPDTLELVRTGRAKKGDVLAVAQVAGIMAAKRTSDLVPMCHALALTGVDLSFALADTHIEVQATVTCTGKTGVEMEALTAVSVACLTIYDMLKAHQRDMVIDRVRLLEKSGGKSGHFVREATEAESTESETIATEAAVPEGFEAAGTVLACSISEKKGTRKHPVSELKLVGGLGIEGDAHAGAWHRQVSLLGNEAVERMRERGLELAAGDFAENILTQGIDLPKLPIGTLLRIGTAELCLTQIGKTCHNDCEIRRITGMCVMPTDGIFCVVTRAGSIKPDDTIYLRKS